MTRDEVLKFVRSNPVCCMATVENGAPRVRAMMTALVGQEGLTFSTGAQKDVCRQIQADPRVELCYWRESDDAMLRIRGRLEPMDDVEVKKAIVQRFDFLRPAVEKMGYECLAVFRLSGGQAGMWSQANAFQPTAFSEF